MSEGGMTHDCYSTKRTTVWPQEKDGKPGFAIKYQDGYISWCPQDTFERDYRPVQGGRLTFGQAVEALKAGKRVRRLGWNGKGMFLFLVAGSRFKVNRPPLLGIYEEGTEIDYHAHVDMKTAQGYVVPWLASQADVLSDDWEEVEQ